MKKLIYTLALTLAGTFAQAQVKVGANPGAIDPSAVLEVESANKGLLPPRMTTTQRNSIASPATGLLVYNTTENCLQINMGTPSTPAWECSSNRSEAGGNVIRFNAKKSYLFSNRDGVGAYTTTLNQERVIPTSNYSFNTTVGGTLTLTYNAFIDSRQADTWTHQEYRLYIDNVLVGTQSFEHNPQEAASISITGFATILAGAHTVELRTYHLSGSVTAGAFGIYNSGYYASIQ